MLYFNTEETMKKSEGFDLMVQFSYARRMFCSDSLGQIHKNSELFDDLGFIALCENDHNEMIHKMQSWAKDFLLAQFELDWMPKAFIDSAYAGLMLLIRLGIDKQEIQRACKVLSDKYESVEWGDLYLENLLVENTRTLVVFPIRSELLFLNAVRLPIETKLFYFKLDKKKVLDELDECLNPAMCVYPIDTDCESREQFSDWFNEEVSRSETAVKYFMNLEEIVYAYLTSILRFHSIGIIQQQHRSDISPEKTVIKTSTTLWGSWVVHIYNRDNLLEFSCFLPDIGLEPGEYRVPMFVV